MKKVLCLIFLVILNSCSESKSQNSETKEGKVVCENVITFGDTKICFPKIAGLKECSNNKLVNNFIKEYYPKNYIVLGYYLKDSDYKLLIDNNEISTSTDNYYVISSLEQLKNKKLEFQEIREIHNLSKSQFEKSNWNNIDSFVKKKLLNGSIDRPILIDSYTKENYISSVILTKVKVAENERISIAIFNSLLIQNRLIYVNYYAEYIDDNSVVNAKKESNYFCLKLIDENK